MDCLSGSRPSISIELLRVTIALCHRRRIRKPAVVEDCLFTNIIIRLRPLAAWKLYFVTNGGKKTIRTVVTFRMSNGFQIRYSVR